MKNQYLYILILCACAGCGSRESGYENQNQNAYARGFALVDTDSGRVAVVYSPWKAGEVQAVYSLDKPIAKIAISSCTQAGMIEELGCGERIVGACNKQLLYHLGQDARIMDLGDAMTPSVERVIRSQAAAVMVSCYSASDPTWQPIEALGIPIIYNNEWQETHPLGRAEWIRFVGAILGQEAKADSIFESVKKHYEDLAKSHSWALHPILILSGQDFRGTWYVPGKNSYMGRLIQDAGATLVATKQDKVPTKTSVPMTTEQVLREYSEAQVWIGVQAKSKDELAQADNKHTWIHAYQTGQVYHMMKRCTADGGNDFWERGVVHPDEILEDLIQIFHPDSVYTRELIYLEQLR